FYTASGDIRTALLLIQERKQLLEALLLVDPTNKDFKGSLAISFSKLGSTHSSLGNLDKALEYFELDIALSKELYEAYPDQINFKNNLAISYRQLGEVALDPAVKREYYQKAEQLWVELTEAFPAYAEFQQNLGVIRKRLAEL
ncbi:MAG: tetratricopeptide repeat protein, partial [Bacteroidota bacterium]